MKELHQLKLRKFRVGEGAEEGSVLEEFKGKRSRSNLGRSKMMVPNKWLAGSRQRWR